MGPLPRHCADRYKARAIRRRSAAGRSVVVVEARGRGRRPSQRSRNNQTYCYVFQLAIGRCGSSPLVPRQPTSSNQVLDDDRQAASGADPSALSRGADACCWHLLCSARPGSRSASGLSARFTWRAICSLRSAPIAPSACARAGRLADPASTAPPDRLHRRRSRRSPAARSTPRSGHGARGRSISSSSSSVELHRNLGRRHPRTYVARTPRRAPAAGARGERDDRVLVRGESSNASVRPPLLELGGGRRRVRSGGGGRQRAAVRQAGGGRLLHRPQNDERPGGRPDRASTSGPCGRAGRARASRSCRAGRTRPRRAASPARTAARCPAWRPVKHSACRPSGSSPPSGSSGT